MLSDVILRRMLLLMAVLFGWIAFAGIALALPPEEVDEPEPCEGPDCPDSTEPSEENEGEVDAEDATVCDNPAGHCEIGRSSGFCECLNGEGVGWAEGDEGSDGETVEGEGDGSGEVIPGDDGSDAPLPSEEECLATLVEYCGEEAPTLEECEKDNIEFCINSYNLILTECFDEEGVPEDVKEKLLLGEWVSPYASDIYQCCVAEEEELEEIGDIVFCIEDGNTCEECGLYEDAIPVGADDDDYGEGADDEGEDIAKGDGNEEADEDDDDNNGDEGEGGEGEGEGDGADASAEDDNVDCTCAVNRSVGGGMLTLILAAMMVFGLALKPKR
ncbi:MAG: hypothetical protein Kow0090_05420 [Myxococcota bacterium]